LVGTKTIDQLVSENVVPLKILLLYIYITIIRFKYINENYKMMKFEKSREDNLIDCVFIRKEIDNCLSNKDYNKAFQLLVTVIHKLDNVDINNFIKYYDKYIIEKTFIRSKL
jgi:hypothetical protein